MGPTGRPNRVIVLSIASIGMPSASSSPASLM